MNSLEKPRPKKNEDEEEIPTMIILKTKVVQMKKLEKKLLKPMVSYEISDDEEIETVVV